MEAERYGWLAGWLAGGLAGLVAGRLARMGCSRFGWEKNSSAWVCILNIFFTEWFRILNIFFTE